MKLSILSVAVIAACLASASQAATITRTYDVTASDFTDGAGDLGSIQSFNAVYMLTFDPSVDTSSPSTSGLTVVTNTLPYATQYTYFKDGGFPDTLTFATQPGSGSPEYGNVDGSYGTFIGGATAATPFSYGVGYFENGNEYYSNIETVTASPLAGVPESSSWLMLIVGVAGVGATLRRSKVMVRAGATAS